MTDPRPNPAAQWDARFSTEDYVYGTKPNRFLVAAHKRLPPLGSVLSIGEGEGRNATFLGARGHAVTAVDASAVGLGKARKLAETRGVTLETIVTDLADFDPSPRTWDAVVSIFCHLPPDLRRRVHRRLIDCLRPGGVLLLEAYTPAQLDFRTGGPPVEELLYSAEMLRHDFDGLEFRMLREIERDVVEGKLHTGRAAVVQVIARKREAS